MGREGPTLSHDFVDLAILLAANELLVLIGKLDLDTNLVLRVRHKLDLRQHGQSSLDGVIRASDVEAKPVEGDISTRIGTDIAKHCSDVRLIGQLPGFKLHIPPCGVELTGLRGVSPQYSRIAYQFHHFLTHQSH